VFYQLLAGLDQSWREKAKLSRHPRDYAYLNQGSPAQQQQPPVATGDAAEFKELVASFKTIPAFDVKEISNVRLLVCCVRP
jgi:myosin heavy subunit